MDRVLVQILWSFYIDVICFCHCTSWPTLLCSSIICLFISAILHLPTGPMTPKMTYYAELERAISLCLVGTGIQSLQWPRSVCGSMSHLRQMC